MKFVLTILNFSFYLYLNSKHNFRYEIYQIFFDKIRLSLYEKINFGFEFLIYYILTFRIIY